MEENEPNPPTSPVSSVPDPPTPTSAPATADPVARFRGLGTNFRAKLIGIDDVPDSRGDQMCQESIIKLKAAVMAAGRHKQKIIINVSLEGIKIVDVMTGEVQHVHPVHRISFIARDTTDRRAFGYVYGAGEGRHQFYGIKTAKAAENLVLALRDLFQVVFDMKKKEMDEAKASQGSDGEEAAAPTSQDPATQQPQQPPPQSGDNILDLKQQLNHIQEGINTMDAIGPWSSGGGALPEAGSEQNGDLFGLASPPPPKQNSSYSEDLFNLGAPAAQPAPQPGAKLTTDQILSGFGGAPQQQQQIYGMPQQAMPQHAMPQQSMQYGGFPAQSYPQVGMAQVPAMGVPQMAAFPSGPSPAIPPRPGAMRPPVPQTLPQGSNQNPFGDAFAGQPPMLAPAVSASAVAPAGAGQKPASSDPFAGLMSGMGVTNTAPANKKDMFKNYQMSKAPQPPPRTNVPAAAEPNNNEHKSPFDSYLMQSVGGLPVANEATAPVDPFAFATPSTNAGQTLDFTQNGINGTSLFG